MQTATDPGTLPANCRPAMSTSVKRIYLAYTAQDAEFRSLLVGAARAARLPVQFVEMPSHVSDVRGRKAVCRAKLQRCDAAIVLVSRHASSSLAVESDVACIHEIGLPLHAVVVGRETATHELLEGWDVETRTGWNWPRIASLLQRLEPAHPIRDAALIAS